MSSDSVTGWINQLPPELSRLRNSCGNTFPRGCLKFARQKLNSHSQIRRRYDEDDTANSKFHRLCRGLSEGRIEAENSDAL